MTGTAAITAGRGGVIPVPTPGTAPTGIVAVAPVPARLAALMARAEKAAAAPWGGETTGAYQIHNADGDGDTAAELVLYSEIGGWFGGTAQDFAAALGTITARELTVRLNSPGGSVWEGLAIANLLRSHPARVTVSVDGIAASIASVILMAGDRRVMQPQTQVMIHDAWGATIGNPADHREMADLLDKQSDNIAAAYRDRSGGRIDTWRNRMRAETWFSAEEALAAGLADEIASYPRYGRPPDEEPEETGREPEPDTATAAKATPRVWDLSVFRYAGREQAPDPLAEPDRTEPGATASPGWQPGIAELAAAVHDLQHQQAGGHTATADAIGAAVRDGLRAAGIGVEAMACPPHETASEEGDWDAGTHEGRLPSPMPVATAKRVYGWYDESQAEDGKIPKSAAKLPHHFVGEDGTPGAASVNGIRNALARLPQTKGLTDAERAAVERHLRGHLPASGDTEDRTEPPAGGHGQPAPPDPPVLAFGRPRPDQPRTLAFGMRRS